MSNPAIIETAARALQDANIYDAPVWKTYHQMADAMLAAVTPLIEAAALERINKAISHAVNYHSLDTKLNMADWQIADLITPEVVLHLQGKTDVQIIEAMTPEERSRIGLEAPG